MAYLDEERAPWVVTTKITIISVFPSLYLISEIQDYRMAVLIVVMLLSERIYGTDVEVSRTTDLYRTCDTSIWISQVQWPSFCMHSG